MLVLVLQHEAAPAVVPGLTPPWRRSFHPSILPAPPGPVVDYRLTTSYFAARAIVYPKRDEHEARRDANRTPG